MLKEADIDGHGHDINILRHPHAFAQHDQTGPLEVVIVADLFVGQIAVNKGLDIQQQIALRPVEEDVAPGFKDVDRFTGNHLCQQLLFPAIRRRFDRHLNVGIFGAEIFVQGLLGLDIVFGAGARHKANGDRVGGRGATGFCGAAGGRAGSRSAGDRSQTDTGHGRRAQEGTTSQALLKHTDPPKTNVDVNKSDNPRYGRTRVKVTRRELELLYSIKQLLAKRMTKTDWVR